MALKSKLSVVIDIGTSKMVAVAGAKNEAGKLEIAGVAKVQSKGIKRGIINNIEEAASAIHELVEHLESTTGEQIVSAKVAYAGQHMHTLNIKRNKIYPDGSVVSKLDLESLLEEARKCELEEGYKLVDIIPVAFFVDGEMEQNPVGSTGRKLEAQFKLLVLPEIYILNLERVFNKVGIELEEISFSVLALSDAVVTPDEKEMGVIVLDFGCGTTKLAVYHENRLLHTAVIPFGGDVVTNDIKEGCSILYKWAEQLKVKFGQALGDFADDRKVVTIPSQNGWEPKEISFKSLAFIIQARVEEIIDDVTRQVQKSQIDEKMGAGIVLTGGTANLENIVSLVKFRTGLDVRKASLVLGFSEKNKEWHHPDYFTALGLLSRCKTSSITMPEKRKAKIEKQPKEPGGFSRRITGFVQGVLNLVDDDNEDVTLN